MCNYSCPGLPSATTMGDYRSSITPDIKVLLVIRRTSSLRYWRLHSAQYTLYTSWCTFSTADFKHHTSYCTLLLRNIVSGIFDQITIDVCYLNLIKKCKKRYSLTPFWSGTLSIFCCCIRNFVLRKTKNAINFKNLCLNVLWNWNWVLSEKCSVGFDLTSSKALFLNTFEFLMKTWIKD